MKNTCKLLLTRVPRSLSAGNIFYFVYKRQAWRDYYVYGGMPFILRLKDHQAKSRYLAELFDNIYISDVLERNRIADRAILV